jgi:aminoglycoside 3-N-acetyltransferase
MITRSMLDQAISDLDLDGRAIMIHSSLRSFGTPVQDGPDGILKVFLTHGCTVLVPTFSESHFAVTPPQHLRPPRNGVNYAEMPHESANHSPERVFSRGCGLVDSNMGSLPAAALQRGDALRGDHPLDSFAAVGPLAEPLIQDQTPSDVYAPIRALTQFEGAVLLIGVGLNRMTALHLAEEAAGRPLFIRWAQRPDGSTSMVQTGGCSEGFPYLEPHLARLASTTKVGNSEWRMFPVKGVLDVATKVIQEDRAASSCRKPYCRRCRDAELGGPPDGLSLG